MFKLGFLVFGFQVKYIEVSWGFINFKIEKKFGNLKILG